MFIVFGVPGGLFGLLSVCLVEDEGVLSASLCAFFLPCLLIGIGIQFTKLMLRPMSFFFVSF